MKKQQILNFWRNVELFNLPDFNKDCSALQEDSLLPWEGRLPKNSKPHLVWQFTLFFGRLEKKSVVNAIDHLLKVQDAKSDWEEPLTGHTCLSALTVDAAGRPDLRSYVAAAYPFAMNCLEKGASLSKIPDQLAAAQADFEIRFNLVPAEPTDSHQTTQATQNGSKSLAVEKQLIPEELLTPEQKQQRKTQLNQEREFRIAQQSPVAEKTITSEEKMQAEEEPPVKVSQERDELQLKPLQTGEELPVKAVPGIEKLQLNPLQTGEELPVKAVQEEDEAQEDGLLQEEIPQDELTPDPNANSNLNNLTWHHLQKEIDYLTNLTSDWNGQPISVYVLTKEVSKNSRSETFLNSFFLEDLNQLLGNPSKDYNQSLNEYLTTEVDEKSRKDLISKKTYLFDSIHPKLMSAGRWPSTIEYGLYTAQLGAVNTVLSDLAEGSGIRGINGPPGTGKTTLLLDVVADCMVRRAKKLLKIDSNQLFTSTKGNRINKENGFVLYHYEVNEKIFDGGGIVVASSNNSAVENITKELPAVHKTDQKTFQDLDYFKSCSEKLIKEESWGILSAALGNFSNRNAFHESLWNSDKKTGFIGFDALLQSIYDPKNNQTDFYQQQFEDTKKKLRSLLLSFEKFQKKAGAFHDQLSVHQHNLNEVIVLEEKLENLSIAQATLLSKEQQYQEAITACTAQASDISLLITLLEKRKPSLFFFQKLFQTSAYKAWKAEIDGHSGQLTETLKEKLSHSALKVEIQDEMKFNAVLQQKNLNFLEKANEAIEAYEATKTSLHQEYGIPYVQLFDTDFFNLSAEQLHLSTPYSSGSLNKLRSEIFLVSLDLHQYAILANAKYFRNNLNTFFEMILGRAVVKRNIAETLWNSFFFCVPVVSTTLASVSRLFASLGKDSIGWLLLDEAGQAPPQAAAGMIFRSRRCVIVGDPLQVEPVVTIPPNLVFKLRQQDDLEAVWSPSQTSVQVLADRVSEKGTYMATGNPDEKIWTGFPLRTHRRCDNPMFGIANEIAYANQMVKATEDEEGATYLGKSTWFAIVATHAPVNKHVLEEELTLLKEKIVALRKAGYSKELFVISPFRSVADACKNKFKTFDGVSCGTIHKFQGKEADVVFLVLGSDPKSPGARLWASKKPNMLNVALTRAKKRFYVIGNKDLWHKCAYFNVMAAQLDRSL